MKTTLKLGTALSLLISTPVLADPLDDADARARAYRAGQPTVFVDGYVPEAAMGGLSASVPYEQEIIGDGVDLVTGAPRALCLETTVMGTLSQAENASDSMLTVVQNDYDLQTFFSSVTDVTASANAGSFAATAHTSVGITRSLNLSVHDLAVVAYYTFAVGTRWYNGQYALDPAYELLRQRDPMTFIGRCGHGFLSSAGNGIGMIAVYKLHQKHEVHASLDSIKATMSVKYGLASVNGSENLTDEQRAILSAYEVTSQCYVMGGRVDTCGLIRSADDVYKVWTNLTGQFDPNSAVALKTGYMTYAQAFSDPRLDIVSERIRLQKAWEQQRSWVNNICSAAPYITDCVDARAAIDLQETRIDDPHVTDVRAPEFGDSLSVFLQADLGHVTLFRDAGGVGQKLDLYFSLNPRASNVVKPDVVYSLKNFNFADVVSSASAELPWPTHWVFELYTNEDGTGDHWQLGHTEGRALDVPMGHSCGLFGWSTCDSFNDRAQSFVLRYIP